MMIIGISYYMNKNSERTYTLHVSEPFEAYFSSDDGSRGCVGQKTDSIFVGNYDCSTLKPGMEIDIFFDRAISTRSGSYQPVKRIDVIVEEQPAQRPAVRPAVKPQVQPEQ